MVRAMAAVDQREYRSNKRHEAHEVGEATLNGHPSREPWFDIENHSETGREYPGLAGFNWEGPHMTFTRLVGESRVWNGPPGRLPDGRCELCLDAELEWHEACLGACNRTGRDELIGKPSRADLAKRRTPAPRDGLKGGTASTDRRRKRA